MFMQNYDPSSAHVYCVFAKPPIGIPEFLYCSSHGLLTLCKHCYWLGRQEYNTHVISYIVCCIISI